METAITLHDLLKIILYLSGAGALIYLALVLKNILSIVSKLNITLEKHQQEIDDTLEQMPIITENASEISKNAATISRKASEIIVTTKPEIEKLVTTVGDVAETVDGLTKSVDKSTISVMNMVVDVSEAVSDTAKNISLNANNVIDYFYIFKEILESLKEVFLRK